MAAGTRGSALRAGRARFRAWGAPLRPPGREWLYAEEGQSRVDYLQGRAGMRNGGRRLRRVGRGSEERSTTSLISASYTEPVEVAMTIRLTAVFQNVPEGYIGFVEELPGANTQGGTLEEARANLLEAIDLVLQSNRELAEETIRGRDVIREVLAGA
jgi:predicted RNase H-like HicB family nuclease